MYYLFMFQIKDQYVITRGENQDKAAKWAGRNVQRGETIGYCNFNILPAADLYSVNHPFDWFNTPMKWLKNN
jgi:hypothetical protein